MLKASSVSGPSILNDVALDKATIPQELLNIDDKVRSNLFPWNGQFSPQLVHAFLATYARNGSFVVDPFMGSGTVLVEAGTLGLPAFGSEINPAAFHMAQTYRLVNVEHRCRRDILDAVDIQLESAFAPPSLFSPGCVSPKAGVKEKIVRLWESQKEPSCQRLLETLIVLLDFYQSDLTAERVLATWSKLRERVKDLPYSNAEIGMANGDARKLPLRDGTVDLVITSPPYINVFNYHQHYRASVEALGWDLLHVARSEMGSNRKHRGNRFFTVIQYCLDIAQTLVELRRVCRNSSRIIFVVGRESNVRKTRFFNSDIVARLGVRSVGLAAEKRQERVFRNKFGSLIYEDIIYFRPGSNDGPDGEPPVEIAGELLQAALDYSPPESRADLKDALARLPEIEPSPLYQPSRMGPRTTA